MMRDNNNMVLMHSHLSDEDQVSKVYELCKDEMRDLRKEVVEFMDLYNLEKAKLQFRNFGFYSNKNQMLEDRYDILDHGRSLSDELNKVGIRFVKMGNFDQALKSFTSAIKVTSLVLTSGVPLNKKERIEILLNITMIRLNLINAHLKNSKNMDDMQEENLKVISMNIVKIQNIFDDKGICEYIVYDLAKREFFNRLQNKLEKVLTCIENSICAISFRL